MIRIQPVVEGHGEVAAVPTLLFRIRDAVAPEVVLRVESPYRIHADRIFNGRWDEFEKAAQVARARSARLLLLLDNDCEEARCPRQVAAELAQRARVIAAEIPLCLVLAECEFESWFQASIASLAGSFGLPPGLQRPPSRVRGAKEWLSRQMPPHEPYRETLHQALMARAMNLDSARGESSFDKLWRDVTHLLLV